MEIKRKSQRFFVEWGSYFERALYLKCLAGDEVVRVIEKVHARVVCEQGGSRLFK